MATGLMAAAGDDVPTVVLKKTIEKGLLKLEEDVNSKKKAQGLLYNSRYCYTIHSSFTLCRLNGQIGKVS